MSVALGVERLGRLAKCVMYCCAAKLGEPRPKISSGAQTLDAVVVGPFTGVPAHTIWPCALVVAFSALATFWNT